PISKCSRPLSATRTAAATLRAPSSAAGDADSMQLRVSIGAARRARGVSPRPQRVGTAPDRMRCCVQLGPDCAASSASVHMDTIGDQSWTGRAVTSATKALFTQDAGPALLSRPGPMALAVPASCAGDCRATPSSCTRATWAGVKGPLAGLPPGCRHRHVQPPRPRAQLSRGAPRPPLPCPWRGNLRHPCGLDGLILAEAGLSSAWAGLIASPASLPSTACPLWDRAPLGCASAAMTIRDTVRCCGPCLHRDSFLEAWRSAVCAARPWTVGAAVPLGVRSVWSEAAGDAPRRLKLEARVLSGDGTEDVGEEEARADVSAKRRRQSAGESDEGGGEAGGSGVSGVSERFIGLHYREPEGRDRRPSGRLCPAGPASGRRAAGGWAPGRCWPPPRPRQKSAAGKLAPAGRSAKRAAQLLRAQLLASLFFIQEAFLRLPRPTVSDEQRVIGGLSELPRCGQPLQLLARAAASLRRLLSSPELLPAAAAEPVGEEEQQAGRHLEAAADAVHQLPEPEIEPMASGFISRELGILKRCLKAELMNLDTIGYSYGFSSYFIMMRVNCTAAMVPTTLMQKNSTRSGSLVQPARQGVMKLRPPSTRVVGVLGTAGRVVAGPGGRMRNFIVAMGRIASCPFFDNYQLSVLLKLSRPNHVHLVAAEQKQQTGNAVAEIVLTTAWYRLMLLIMMPGPKAPARLTPEMVAVVTDSPKQLTLPCRARPAMLSCYQMASTLPEVRGAAAIPAAATGGRLVAAAWRGRLRRLAQQPLDVQHGSSKRVFTSTMQPAG
uniref:HECT domain-containing protein n=1 Tax=Macrostomum lignano TaxID=282301 RepID=A0A1I8F873_9PLAT